MFGSLRWLLAMMVAFSHAGVAWHGYHLGVPAVVVNGKYVVQGEEIGRAHV